MSRQKRKKVNLTRSLFHWHKTAGVILALGAILLALTGIALNHSDDLSLSDISIHNRSLMRWYGITTTDIDTGFQAGEHWYIQAGEQLFRDTQPSTDMGVVDETLNGAVALAGMTALLFDDHIRLLDPDGQLIDALRSGDGLPAAVSRISTSDQRLLIETSQGVYLADADLIDWDDHEAGANTAWSVSAQLPDDIRKAVAAQYQGPGLSLERIMLDLHSGRILTRVGPWVTDLAGVLLIFLAGSGLVLWLRQFRHQLRAKRKRRR